MQKRIYNNWEGGKPMSNFIWMALPMIITYIIIFTSPVSMEKENAKRAAKGKPALTEAGYQKNVKTSRIIAAIILAVSWVIAVLIIEFA
jgi:Flp pilus assembly protein TadB